MIKVTTFKPSVRHPRPLRCRLGFHPWGDWVDSTGSQGMWAKPTNVVGTRCCTRCGGYQVMEFEKGK